MRRHCSGLNFEGNQLKARQDMHIPNLKRVKVSSVQELRNWLGKGPDQHQRVMIVTCNKTSTGKFLSRESVQNTLAEYGWAVETRYTLNGNLVGHVASPS